MPSNFTLYCDPNVSNCSTIYFAQNVIQFLPADSASLCRVAFPLLSKSAASLSPTQLANNISNFKLKMIIKKFLFYYINLLDQISFLTPSQLNNLSPENSILIAQALTSKGLGVSPTMAKNIGANIPLR